MPTDAAPDRVHRLLEMVVEEVSLVDRAANKRRFLIVKRSDGMDDTTNDAAPVEGDLNDSSDAGAERVDAPETTGERTGVADERTGVAGERTGVAGEPGDEPRGALDEAVAALDGLAEAVELLDGPEPEQARGRIAELVAQLQVVAGKLGVDLETAPRERPPKGDEPEPEPAPEVELDRLSSAVDGMREALEQFGVGLAAALPAPEPPAPEPPAEAPTPAAGEPTPTAAPAPQSAPPHPLQEQLGALLESVRSLTDTVREQQKRLARVEKRFGLPSSQAVGERPPRPNGGRASWPLDLNQPVDREHVDPSVSFHDL